MNKKYKNRIINRIKLYCKSTYELIPTENMKLGDGIFNNRCQMNSVQKVKEGNAEEVYAVLALNTDDVIVHFINLDNEGHYIDNTLGFKFTEYEYYLIKKVDISDHHKMDTVLMDLKRNLLNLHSNNLINKVMFVDEYNLGI